MAKGTESSDTPAPTRAEERDDAGTLRMEALVGSDGPEGTVRTFDERGRPLVVAEYAAGVPHGLMRIFDQGRPQLELNFVRGMQDGAAVSFHPDGSVSSRSTWALGVQEGGASHFAPGGVRVREEEYLGGRLHGVVVDFYPGGGVQQLSTWKEGVLHGEQATLDPSGKVLSRIWYEQGVPRPVPPAGGSGHAPPGPATPGARPPAPQETVLDRVLARWRG
jgi:antitoxin component YwqK of YwqJK toxin-antitoxin module